MAVGPQRCRDVFCNGLTGYLGFQFNCQRNEEKPPLLPINLLANCEAVFRFLKPESGNGVRLKLPWLTALPHSYGIRHDGDLNNEKFILTTPQHSPLFSKY